MKLLGQLFSSHRLYIGGICVGVSFGAISATFLPFTLKLLIDDAVQGRGENLIPIASLYMIILVIAALSGRIVDSLLIQLIPKMRSILVLNAWDYLSRHSHAYFADHLAGSLGNKISDMTRSVEIFIQTGIGVILYQIIQFITVSVLMSSIHSLFACILVIWVLSFVTVSLICSMKTVRYSNNFSEAYSKLIGEIVDRLTNMAAIKFFSGRGKERELLTEQLKAVSSEDTFVNSNIRKTKIFQDVLVFLLFFFMILISIRLYRRALLAPGDFAFILISATTVLQGLWNLMGRGLMELMKYIGIYRQAVSTIYVAYDLKEASDAQPLIISGGKIEFKDVSFCYDDVTIFNNLNFVIQPKERVGVVGLSGAGKTTLIHLLMRSFDTKGGEILIDGQNIRCVTIDSLYCQISAIHQDSSLFNRSLLENVRYGKNGASDEEILEACRKAYCHEFISCLKMGYHSMVGEKGVKLSTGQRQRILIARAILKNAPILILDEPTSALDAETETKVLDGLNFPHARQTIIMISHRLSSLLKMDRIVVFDKGTIVESGHHLVLLKKGGLYAKLWNSQNIHQKIDSPRVLQSPLLSMPLIFCLISFARLMGGG